jgi:rSAM/selenodomain-associated transferase 1
MAVKLLLVWTDESNQVIANHNLRPALVVMVKAPRAGQVKTRLAPLLSNEDAVALAACFAQDAMNLARLVSVKCIIAYAPSDGRATLEQLLPDADLWLAQTGADLGARLTHMINEIYNLGYSPILVIGTDSPTLPAQFINEAFDVLSNDAVDVALGATDDGGFYAVGVLRPVEIFNFVGWSTAQAHADVARNTRALNLRSHELPRWYDVDTGADLQRLRDELFNQKAARRRAPQTFRWLTENHARLKF